MKQELIKRLESLHEMLVANTSVDWSENDPSEEFQNLADIVKGYIPTDRQDAIENLSHFICDDDVEEAYDRLLAQQEIDGSVSAWDFVIVYEPYENKQLTVDDILNMEF